MIYASLKPIHQWHNGWVVPGYLALGLMGGLLVLDFLVRLWVRHAAGLALLTLVVVADRLVAQGPAIGCFIDTTSAPSTVASATALGSRGRVRLFESPHTEENYLLKEMGFQIARKHARRLRRIAWLTGFALPALASLVALILSGRARHGRGRAALASAALGLVVERWLFFAEAKHTVTLVLRRRRGLKSGGWRRRFGRCAESKGEFLGWGGQRRVGLATGAATVLRRGAPCRSAPHALGTPLENGC